MFNGSINDVPQSKVKFFAIEWQKQGSLAFYNYKYLRGCLKVMPQSKEKCSMVALRMWLKVKEIVQ